MLTVFVGFLIVNEGETCSAFRRLFIGIVASATAVAALSVSALSRSGLSL